MSENPYKYDLEPFLDVPDELLLYREAEPIAVSVSEPAAVAFGLGGRILVAGTDGIEPLSSEGKGLAVWPLSSPGTAIAVSETVMVYVGLGDHVEVYDADGRLQAAWTPLGENAFITSLAVAGDNVFAADFDSRLVWKFDLTGKLLGHIGSSSATTGDSFILPSPYFDLAAGPDGSLWTANPGRLRVEERDNEGGVKRRFGKPSVRIGGFCGCCNPTHIALDSEGRIFTSEKGLPRVKRFNADGGLTAVVAGPRQFAEGTVGLDLAVGPDGKVFVLDPKRGAVRVFVPKESVSEESK
ncbi:MAG: NHL repeat-containing protein [Planctomycetota bacterium]|jgi:hypothetical protein